MAQTQPDGTMIDLTTINSTPKSGGGYGGILTGIGALITPIMNNSGQIAGIFDEGIREDNLAMAQAQAELAQAQADNKPKPNYLMYGIIALVVVVGIYFVMSKKN